LRDRLVFLEMSRLEVGLVCVDVGVHLEYPDARRVLFIGHGVKRQHSGFEPNSGLDLLFRRSPEGSICVGSISISATRT
jgi:hypothetical protein